jgi:acetyl-CoA carboxylase beta subunit
MQDQLYDAIAKTSQLSAVRCEVAEVQSPRGAVRMVWVSHDFGFLGGSLGSAEGEKITRVRHFVHIAYLYWL